MKTRRTEGQPHEPLTRLANSMIDHLGDQPDAGDVRAVVMLFRDTAAGQTRGGIGLAGYDTDTEAIADVFAHLAALFEANGKRLIVAPLGGAG
jgi:hypothetical protein